MFIHDYPYTDLNELNLEWIIKQIKQLSKEWDEFEAVNKLTFAGAWSVGKRYPKWSVVEDGEGNGYLAVKDVPPGIYLDNDEYWQPVMKYSALYTAFNARLEELERMKGEITFRFVGGSDSSPSGQSLIIDLGDGSAIIEDFGYNALGTEILNCLATNNITKIKAFVISHYHDDHVGTTPISGLKAVLNAMDVSECVAYLPHGLVNYDSFIGDTTAIQTAHNAIVAYCEEKGIEIVEPTEGQVIELSDDLTATFNNLDPTYFAQYYTYTYDNDGDAGTSTNYNNFSMITTYKHFNNLVGVMGDIGELAESKNRKVVCGLDVYVFPHHGGNKQIDKIFLHNITAQIGVIATGARQWADISFYKEDIEKLVNADMSVYSTAKNGVVDISSTFNKIYAKQTAKPLDLRATYASLDCGEELKNLNLNGIILAGNYYVQNKNTSQTIENSPFPNAGYKLVVMKGTPNRPLTQIAFKGFGASLATAYRWCHNVNASTEQGTAVSWSQWRYTFPSVFINKAITNDMLMSGFELSGASPSFQQNHVVVQNCFVELGFDIKAGSSVSSGDEVLEFFVDTHGRGVYFYLYDTSGTPYRFRTTYVNDQEDPKFGYVKVLAMSTIPSGTRLIGNVVYGLYPDNTTF